MLSESIHESVQEVDVDSIQRVGPVQSDFDDTRGNSFDKNSSVG